MTLTVGSLFAGIGGFDLGFERAGMKTIWQVEIDDYCRRVLARHFPDAERFGDIRECGAHNLKPVDVICGGFPCQDISTCNPEGTGLDGERSGLWVEYLRLIGELRPRFIVVENVAVLVNTGLQRILGGLASMGYDAEWGVLSACAFGAPHTRERLFVVAYPTQKRFDGWRIMVAAAERLETSGCDSELLRPWAIEPRISRVAYGIPRRLDRVGSLGNAVVPQIAEWIGHRIVEASQ